MESSRSCSFFLIGVCLCLQVWRVRTVLRNRTLNCFPTKNWKKRQDHHWISDRINPTSLKSWLLKHKCWRDVRNPNLCTAVRRAAALENRGRTSKMTECPSDSARPPQRKPPHCKQGLHENLAPMLTEALLTMPKSVTQCPQTHWCNYTQ